MKKSGQQHKQHKAKPSSGGTRKYGRNREKCAEYRRRVGKPHREGNKR